MNGKALVVIDIQNDITKHYRDIIHRLNSAIDWAAESGMEVLYIKHNNLSAGTRTFKPGTKGEELAPELKVVSDKVFVKTKASALTSESFSDHIRTSGITEFYLTGADCVTSYDRKKLPEMLDYYASKGCEVKTLEEYRRRSNIQEEPS